MHELNAKKSLSGKSECCNRNGDVKLHFHSYRYFPYEKDLAFREVRRICKPSNITVLDKCFCLRESFEPERYKLLTYVAEVENKRSRFPTTQFQLEQTHRGSSGTGKRQATRYSVHGLHEYRGRFNPQVARFLLNYFGATAESRILDPFCGSGTTLVEAALRGCAGTGIDMNPLAVFVCNAKLHALTIPAADLQDELKLILAAMRTRNGVCRKQASKDDGRREYLEKWFPLDTLNTLEVLRKTILELSEKAAPIFLSLASDILRDYSLQEPSDLRIRRRMCPLPTKPLMEVFETRSLAFVQNLAAAQTVTGLLGSGSKAILSDSRELVNGGKMPDASVMHYDFVITSPPYATAMPYIDTQRLSLVWLGLCKPSEIRELEADAIGSREIHALLEDWDQRLLENTEELPASAANYCKELHAALGKKDGFRRQAVPANLYRYFAATKRVFSGLKQAIKKGGQLGFVIGTNHTTLGGKRFNIDTPEWWSVIAENAGLKRLEVIKLQTYQRYGLHQKNSINGESLSIFEVL